MKPDEYMHRRDREIARKSRLSSAELLESLGFTEQEAIEIVEEDASTGASGNVDDDMLGLYRTPKRGLVGNPEDGNVQALNDKLSAALDIIESELSPGRPPSTDGLSFDDRYKIGRRNRSSALSAGTSVAAEVRKGEQAFTISTNF